MENNGIHSNGHHDMEAVRERQRLMVLPPGVFFMPTDEELLGVYLRNQAAGRVTHRVLDIPTREIYVPGADPWVVHREVVFPYCKNGEVYCFTRRSRRGADALRAAGSGRWVARGNDVVVVSAEPARELLGYKLILEFVPDGGVVGHEEERSNWFMHEYRLPGGRGRPTPSSSPSQELVLCRIFQHKEEEEEEEGEGEGEGEEEEEGEEEVPDSPEEASSITGSE